MMESRAAIRYAKAAIDLAAENNAADAVQADMTSIVATVAESDELQELLESPVVSAVDKKKALTAIFNGQHKITEGLVATLVANKRLPIIAEVAKQYMVLFEQLKGEDIAHVTTATALTPDLETKILEKVKAVTGKAATLQQHIDTAIIGGFVLRVGDLQFDASIAGQLAGLKRKFSNSL